MGELSLIDILWRLYYVLGPAYLVIITALLIEESNNS